MKIRLLISLFIVGCANLHAQLFSITPSIGISRSFLNIKSPNATSLGKIAPLLDKGGAFGVSLSYYSKQHYSINMGYNYLNCGYGWQIVPVNNGRFTPVTQTVTLPLHQFFIGYNYHFDLLFQSKTDKQEKKIGWNYDAGDSWLRLNVGVGPAVNFMSTPVENLHNSFLPGTSYNNDNPEEVWMLGYETPRYVNKTSMGLWFRTGLTFVKKGKDKLSLDFVMNLGLQDKYIIETNNQFGNTRTGQLIREEQFNVVSRGTSMALMLSYPIYFGKKK